MEGYIKVRAGGLLTDFTTYYVIIDEQNLIIYEKLDEKTYEPINLQSIFNLKDSTIKKVNKNDVKYGLQIKGNTQPIGKSLNSKKMFSLGYKLLLCSDIPTNEKMWYVALNKAIKLHNENEYEELKLKDQLAVLSIDIPLTDLTIDNVRKTYKKMSLKVLILSLYIIVSSYIL